jgi:hypothetical protein
VKFAVTDPDFVIDVNQVAPTEALMFGVQQNNQIILWSDNCTKVSATVALNGTRLIVTGATPGTYVLGVKYDSKSVQTALPITPPVEPIAYTWSATITYTGGIATVIPESTAEFSIVYGCIDTTPLPPLCEMPKSGDLNNIQANTPAEPVECSAIKVYPNPSAGGPVNFEFMITDAAKATLDLYSASGQKVATLFNENVEACMPQKVTYNKPLAEGTYIYTLWWNDKKMTGKLIIKR